MVLSVGGIGWLRLHLSPLAHVAGVVIAFAVAAAAAAAGRRV